MLGAESSQCNSALFDRVVGQVEVWAGQVNFRGSLPCSASNVLEPMLQPADQGLQPADRDKLYLYWIKSKSKVY